MIALRKENDCLCQGEFNSLYEGNAVYAFERSYNGVRLISICNMTAKNKKVPSSLPNGKVLVSSYNNQSNELKPFEFRLIEVK